MKTIIDLFVHDSLTTTSNKETFFSKFTGNSEAHVSKLLENAENCFLGIHAYSDVYRTISSNS